jgi:hypothetical protein
MNRLLLIAVAPAALLIPAAPGGAQNFTGSGFTTVTESHVPHVRRGPTGDHVGVANRHRHRHDRSGVLIDWGWNGDWAYFNNRTFEPDSYNDWWHDRPDRAYPHWMQTNQNCARMWYSGDTLRC